MDRAAETTWDDRGVPTITADSDLAVCAGFGHAQAVAHAREVLELYGVARGRAAALWGADFLPGDVEHARLGYAASARQWLEDQEPETFARLDAFCDGFNAACADDVRRGGDRRDALPVTPYDVLAHALSVFGVFARFWDDGLAFAPLPGGLLGGGSNAWAVTAERSATGEAMLLTNPHIPWVGPFRLFEARSVSPTRTCHGVTPIGFPWQSFGYTPQVGWTQTVNPLPQLWVYALDGDDETYRHDGEDVAYDRVDHVLEVRGGDPVTVTALRSVHGPVLTAPDGARVAVRVAGVLHHPASRCLETWRRMSLATDVHGVLAAQDERGLPMFNVVAADSAGSVAAAFCGVVPHRPGGAFDDHRHRLDGSDPDVLWDQVEPSTSLPRVVDPACGWVQNVNETPWWFCEPPLEPTSYPDGVAPAPHLLRDVRSPISRERLRGLDEVSADDLLDLKWSTRIALADAVLPDLLAAADEVGDLREATAALRAWDGYADPDSAGYPLFHLWAHEHLPLSGLLMDGSHLTPPESAGDAPTGLVDPAAAAAALRRALATLIDRGLAADVTYGAFAALGEADDLRVPASGAPSFLGALKCLELTPTPDGWVGIGGDTWISLVRFGADGPQASAILVAGNATEPGAPTSASQLPPFRDSRLTPLAPLPRQRVSAGQADSAEPEGLS